MSDLREAFEAWHRSLGLTMTLGELERMEARWQGWQAALGANGEEAPVGWMWEAYGQRNFTAGCHHKEVLEADGVVMTPLYTRPAPPSVAVPEGWREEIERAASLFRQMQLHDESNGLWEPAAVEEDMAERLEKLLTAAPSPDHSGDANKMVDDLQVAIPSSEFDETNPIHQAADAYSYACEIMEKHQAKRVNAGKDPGTIGSLCDGLAWLYEYIEELEDANPSPDHTADAGKVDAECQRILGRLNSSDPDFNDCADAAALIIRLQSELSGPDGFDTWKDAALHERKLRLSPAPAADGGKVVPDSEFSDEFAKWWEDHGQFVRAGGGNYERTFAFEAWRHLYPRITAPAADGGKVDPVDDSSTVYRIGDLGNQIHNLGCSQQNNEELADSLAELAHQAWVLQRDVMRDLTATHPAQPRNEVQAEALEEYAAALDKVFAAAQDAKADNCPAWHAGQFAKDARKFAERLRSNGGEE